MEYLYHPDNYHLFIENPYYYLEPLTFTHDEEFNDAKIRFWESLSLSLLEEPDGISSNGQEIESSISHIGELEIPETASPVHFDPTLIQYQDYLDSTQPDPWGVSQNYFVQFQNYLDNAQPYPYIGSQDYLNQQQDYLNNSQPSPYIVPQGYGVPYHDSSYIGYSNLSTDSTHWESDVRYLHPDSYTLLHDYHTESGTTTFSAPKNFVMQQCQELGNSPASECDQSAPIFSREIFSSASPSLTPATSPTTHCSSFPITPEDLPSSSFSPFTNQTPAASGTKLRSRRRPLKTGRKFKKPFNPTKKTTRRKSPNGRVRPRSQFWLDTVFHEGRCKFCGGGSSDNRQDRLLEHLVSSHFIQPIKEMKYYDREHLEDEAKFQAHYIETPAQFEYTKRFINLVKCSLCVKNTSLVLRDLNIEKHLETVHADEDEATREKELERFLSLAPDERQWYNIHDKFLCEFPNH